MKSVSQWLKDDWEHNRVRLVIETAGALCFISVYVVLAWFGEDAKVMLIFLLTIAGATLHTVNLVFFADPAYSKTHWLVHHTEDLALHIPSG